ncbi:hypothetical protein B6D52_02080 [Candidatus Parcubacteria bacterium 4484_255]|nr:MAG: hypothetical protein B6D52_02080 [Candidatus Parcubacteria bacterium 4484_255]
MLLNGKKIAQKIKKRLKNNIERRKLIPGLAIILIGKNPNSAVYVRLKQKASKNIGIKCQTFLLSSKCRQKDVLNLIEKLNNDPKTHGIIIQMPVPKRFNPDLLVNSILPSKDIDGFQKKSKFVSPTHQAIIRLMKASKQNLKNKKAIILSKNPIFANPLKNLLKNLSIETFYEVSPHHKNICEADIIISALGKPNIIKPKMIKKNAIVIDVGYSRINNKLFGDVDSKIKRKDVFLSPVPGGVGPLTVAYLLKNVYLSARNIK